MREILFKAKRTDNGEWVEGDLLKNNNEPIITVQVNRNYIGYSRVKDSSVGTGTHWYIETPAYRVHPETVCQYTGFTDKDMKKVFHKDKGRAWMYDAVEEDDGFWWEFTVELVNGCWVLAQIGFDHSNKPFDEYPMLYEYQHEIEITGNIHDK